jgi:hypothetical protein
MSQKSIRTLAGMLALILAGTLGMADAPSAVLYARGDVNVNGNSVNRSISVFDGDTIQTSANAAGTVALKGGSVLVQGNSVVIFGSSGLRLETGGATIKTMKGMSSSVGAFTVVPAETEAQYAVQRGAHGTVITALQGRLNISGAGKDLALAAGNSVTLEPAPVQGGGGGGSLTGLWIGLAAAGVAGAIAAAVITQQSSSPSGP